MQLRISFILLLAVMASSCAETRITEHEDWEKKYEQYGIKNACIILRDNNHESIHYYNEERCKTRYTPASTFKIFNSMVALETAIAPDERLLIKWDSSDVWPDACKQDLTMNDAFRESCLWYYQEIARRVGAARMQHYLDTIKYGNMSIAGGIDKFWINDSLQISADEQVGFVKRIYFAELPMSERSQRIVKNMMLREDKPNYKLYYKTGTGRIKGDKYIYWVTGFVERIQKVKEPKGSMNKSDERNYPYFFSQNFEMPVADTSRNWFETRIQVLKEVLTDYGAIPKDETK